MYFCCFLLFSGKNQKEADNEVFSEVSTTYWGKFCFIVIMTNYGGLKLLLFGCIFALFFGKNP